MDVPISSLPDAPIVAGLEPTPDAEAILAQLYPGVRLIPDFAPPHRNGLLRLETASGLPFNRCDVVDTYWHRPPYTLDLRLVRYDNGSVLPEVIDRAVIGTRGSREAFRRHVDATALRLVEDAFLGRSRGAISAPPCPATQGGRWTGWIDHLRARCAERLLSEWWSLGVSSTSLRQIVTTGRLGPVDWLHADKGDAYFADPFPWPGTGELLVEEMPMHGGHGRIVALTPDHGTYRTRKTILADAQHHSYPCTFQENGTTWMVPEATERGTTVLYRLEGDGQLHPVSRVAPQRRLSDPTLFRHDGRYWIACADLDFGAHDSLCLLHATCLEGPWQSHRLNPVRIDIRGARPAGNVFRVGDALFRPGQNCAATYGGGITLYRIDALTPDDYQETAVASLLPDRNGPFPHGLHTLVNDGTHTWVDGKRFVLDWTVLSQKLRRRLWSRPEPRLEQPA